MSLPDWWRGPLPSSPPQEGPGQHLTPQGNPATADSGETDPGTTGPGAPPGQASPAGTDAPAREALPDAEAPEPPPEPASTLPAGPEPAIPTEAEILAGLTGKPTPVAVTPASEGAPVVAEKPATAETPPVNRTELVIYGATAAGVAGAVGAARHGIEVVLLEPGRHVGGMVSGGLGYTDLGDPRAIGGLAREFWHAVAEHYGVEPGHYAGPEPHVAEEILLRRLERAGVKVCFGVRLAEVAVADGTIRELRDELGTVYEGGVFVDATYEGDLLAAAGIPYTIGREDRSKHQEVFAGRREFAPGKHQFRPFLSPFTSEPSGWEHPDHPGFDNAGSGALLPLIHRRRLADVGTGDGGVMAYGFRVCLSRGPDRLPFPQRDGYDPAEWELGRRYLRMLADDGRTPRAERLLGLVPNLPGDKCDGNSIGPFSLNLLDGSNWAYPDAPPDERERIRQRHLDYTQDFLHFLSTDPDVPKEVRESLLEWGLPADEFTDTGGFPHQLYVREARRMVGEYVLTEHDLHPTPVGQYDAIALGSYHIDIREVQRTWQWAYEHPDPMPSVFNEGYLSVGVRPYQIPYRCLVPRYSDCTNLLVPVCLSASHVAFASVRMEPQYQMLGHAAGVAAALALRDDRPVQRVDVARLQDVLTTEGQILAL